jgi:hypothetical protein
VFSTEVAGSRPTGHVPAWCATPATRDVVLEVRVARDQVVVMHAEVAEKRLELVQQLLLGLVVRRGVGDLNAAVAAQGHAVLEPREILG